MSPSGFPRPPWKNIRLAVLKEITSLASPFQTQFEVQVFTRGWEKFGELPSSAKWKSNDKTTWRYNNLTLWKWYKKGSPKKSAWMKIKICSKNFFHIKFDLIRHHGGDNPMGVAAWWHSMGCLRQWFETILANIQKTNIYMRVVLNSFIWKTPSSPKKNFLSPNFRELHVYLSRYMLAKIFKKNMDVWYPQIVPGVWSLVTLHSAAAALKHLRSALRCWSLLTFIGQFWHNKSTV